MKKSKWWFDNEKKVLKRLGYTPCPLSGAGDVHKEDGYNEYSICQLKSTDKNSYTLKLLDLQKLIYHAKVSHKIPVFIIEFINQETLICVKQEDLQEYAKLLLGLQNEVKEQLLVTEQEEQEKRLIKANKPIQEEAQQIDQFEEMFRRRQERKMNDNRKGVFSKWKKKK